MKTPNQALQSELWQEFREDLRDPSIHRGNLTRLVGGHAAWKLGRIVSALECELPDMSRVNTAAGILVVNPEDPEQVHPAMSKGKRVVHQTFDTGFHSIAANRLQEVLGPETKVAPGEYVRFFSVLCLTRLRGEAPSATIPTVLVDFDNIPSKSSTRSASVTDAVARASERTPGTQWVYHRAQDNLSATVVTDGKLKLIDTSRAA